MKKFQVLDLFPHFDLKSGKLSYIDLLFLKKLKVLDLLPPYGLQTGKPPGVNPPILAYRLGRSFRSWIYDLSWVYSLVNFPILAYTAY